MPRSTCTVNGCRKPTHGKGYCSMHYRRYRRDGFAGGSLPSYMLRSDTCGARDCSNPVKARGLCNRHYQKMRAGHEIPVLESLDNGPTRATRATSCHIGSCGESAYARGYCNMHYIRYRKHGADSSEMTAPPMRREVGTVFETNTGYLMRSVHGKKIFEHRAVMETLLGRPLLKNETVHHKNGLRSDNDPENLELWCSFQPYGQRASDLIEYVVRYHADAVIEGLKRAFAEAALAA